MSTVIGGGGGVRELFLHIDRGSSVRSSFQDSISSQIYDMAELILNGRYDNYPATVEDPHFILQ